MNEGKHIEKRKVYIGIYIGVCTHLEILWGPLPRVYFLIERTNPRKGGFIVEIYAISSVRMSHQVRMFD